jgi:hypothetical protein
MPACWAAGVEASSRRAVAQGRRLGLTQPLRHFPHTQVPRSLSPGASLNASVVLHNCPSIFEAWIQYIHTYI